MRTQAAPIPREPPEMRATLPESERGMAIADQFPRFQVNMASEEGEDLPSSWVSLCLCGEEVIRTEPGSVEVSRVSRATQSPEPEGVRSDFSPRRSRRTSMPSKRVPLI